MRNAIAAAPIRMPTIAIAVGAESPVRTEPVLGFTPPVGTVSVTVAAAVVVVVGAAVCVSASVVLVL